MPPPWRWHVLTRVASVNKGGVYPVDGWREIELEI